ncbi:hypothetical protein ACH0CI_27460 [Priestia sp. 179-F W1.4 NHS]|uniref:hypothetical protein n=1 Tax=Priestia sp. 179-F W1.4 NHS TaxID=3374296 RepID=UPI003879D384
MDHNIITKDGVEIVIRDLIGLTSSQRKEISLEARRKTRDQWIDEDDNVKVKLKDSQKEEVLGTLKYHFKESNFTKLLSLFSFTDHAEERAIERIENRDPAQDDVEIKPMTKIKILKALRDASIVHDLAEWKGRGRLSYRLIGEVDNIETHICISFHEKVAIITVIN